MRLLLQCMAFGRVIKSTALCMVVYSLVHSVAQNFNFPIKKYGFSYPKMGLFPIVIGFF